MRISSIIIFHLSKLRKAKFFMLCDVIFLVRLQGKFEIDDPSGVKLSNCLFRPLLNFGDGCSFNQCVTLMLVSRFYSPFSCRLSDVIQAIITGSAFDRCCPTVLIEPISSEGLVQGSNTKNRESWQNCFVLSSIHKDYPTVRSSVPGKHQQHLNVMGNRMEGVKSIQLFSD